MNYIYIYIYIYICVCVFPIQNNVRVRYTLISTYILPPRHLQIEFAGHHMNHFSIHPFMKFHVSHLLIHMRLILCHPSVS